MQSHFVELIDPTAEREIRVGKTAAREGGLEGKRIGLLDNSKPNADRFLEYVGEILRERYRDIEILPRRKSTRTEADCLPELIEKCDAVITAFAD